MEEVNPTTGHIVNKQNLPNLLLKLPPNPAEYITRKAILPNLTLKLPNPAECISRNKASLPDLMNQVINEKRLEKEEREAPKTNKPLPSSPQSDTHLAYNALSVPMSTQIPPSLPSIMLPADEPIEINQSSKIYNQKLLPATANMYGSSEEAIAANFHVGCNALSQDYTTTIAANEHNSKRKNNRKYKATSRTDHTIITEPFVASVSHYGRLRKPKQIHDVKELGDA